MKQNFYQFEAENIQGEKVSMEDYTGKVVLVVNTATKCGLAPQFEGLEKLYQTYKDDGFVILGFPSNQFANQEPGDSETIQEACKVNHGVTFPLFSKIDVNGNDAHPIFKYLKGELGGTLGSAIKWNFTKFLIGKDGQPIKRFAPVTKPEKIEKYIKEALSK